MAAPSGTIWGSVSSNGYGKLGLYISASSTNTQVTLTVQVWLALKWNINDSSNSYIFSYTNDSGGTSYGANGTSLSLNFGTSSGAGWADVSQKQLASYTLTYTRGTSAKTVSLSSSLKNLGSSSYSVAVSTTYSIPAKPSYTVAYNANGGSGAPSSQTKWYGTALTLSSSKPTRTGYTFKGWGTSASDTSVDYAAGASYTANAAITLYAIWQAVTYTVSFNANGGSGAPGNQTKTYGVTLTLSSTKPTRSGYNFVGWGTSATATSAAYAAGGSYTTNAAITLYAVWSVAYVKPFIENIKVYRCNSSGTASDDGTYFKAVFDWETFNTVSSIKIEWKLTTATSYSSSTVSASGKSGTVTTGALGSGGISTESSYDIRITVADSGGSTSADRSISSMMLPIDTLAGGKGIAFGKTAETEGLMDVAFDANFRGSVYGKVRGLGELPAIPDGADFNTYTTPGAWSVRSNADAETMSNMPIQKAGILEVFMCTGQPSNYEGWLYVRQKFIPYTLNYPTYERDLVWNLSEWTYGSWRMIDHIVECGTSGVWYYQKMASGVAKCWTTKQFVVTGSTTSSLLGGYYSYASIDLPFTFISVFHAVASAQLGTGVGFGLAKGFTTYVNIYCVGNQNSNAIGYNCEVVGTWK